MTAPDQSNSVDPMRVSSRVCLEPIPMQVNRQINQKPLFFLLLRCLCFKFKNIIRIFKAEKYRNDKNI